MAAEVLPAASAASPWSMRLTIVPLAPGLEEPVRSRQAAGQEEQDQQEPFHGDSWYQNRLVLRF